MRQMGFLHPTEFLNCHIMSVLCKSSSYCFSAQTRQVTVPLHAKIPSSCLEARVLPQKHGNSLPGQLGSAQGSREGQRGCRAQGACTSLACHCVSAVCRSHGGHGERQVRHHDAHRDLPPRCPAATADTEVGHQAIPPEKSKKPAPCWSHRGLSSPVPKNSTSQFPASCLHLKQKGLPK